MRRTLLTCLFALAAAACSSPPFIELPDPLEGVVVDVSGTTFIVETLGGERFGFTNANPLDDEMGQTHMNLHRADRTPVRVSWRRDGYRLIAVEITDAT